MSLEILYLVLGRLGLGALLATLGLPLFPWLARRQSETEPESRASLSRLALGSGLLLLVLPWLRSSAGSTSVVNVSSTLVALLPRDAVAPAAVPSAALPVAPPPGPLVYVGALWSLLVLSRLARLFVATRRMHALIERAEPLPRELAVLLEDVSHAAVTRVPRAVLSREAAVPFVTGAGVPLLVLPSCLGASLDEDGWRWIMRHEIVHLQRGDARVNFLLQLLAAFLPLGPTARQLQREHAQACEEAVDARVSLLGPHAYASTLLTVAERYALQPMQSELVAVSTPSLTRRIHMLTHRFNRRARIAPLAVLAAAFSFGVLVLPRVRAETTASADGYREKVRPVMESHLPQVRECFERSGPTATTHVEVAFRVTATGNVTDAHVEQPDPELAAFNRCLLTALNSWSFPAPADVAGVVVHYPFTLMAAGSSELKLGVGQNMELHESGVTRISIMNPEIADVKTTGNGGIQLLGQSKGETVLVIWTGEARKVYRVLVK